MESLAGSTITLYSLMATLLYYQKLHLKHFQGSSQSFGTILGLSAFLGTLTGFGYLVYFGIYASWSGAAILFISGIMAAAVVGGFLERLLGGLVMSMAAFVAWPLCAYVLFTSAPA